MGVIGKDYTERKRLEKFIKAWKQFFIFKWLYMVMGKVEQLMDLMPDHYYNYQHQNSRPIPQDPYF